MVRAFIFVSAVLAIASSVSAIPTPGGLVDVKAKYIGTGDIDLRGALNEVVDARGVHVHNIANDAQVANHGLLAGLLKREEAPTAIRIARKAGSKKNKKQEAQA